MRLELDEFREAISRLFDHVVKVGEITHLEIDQPFYWHIPESSRYDMDAKPPELTVGSLADDWELAKKSLGAGQAPVAYTLTELAPLLSYLGEVAAAKMAAKGG